MKFRDLTNIIEKCAPISSAYEWDNVGLMIGSLDKEVNKVLLTLDVTLSAVDEAISQGCDAIISHHPLFFKPIKIIDQQTIKGKIIEKCIKNNISVYSAHTNLDVSKNGINKYLIEKFDVSKVEYLTDEGLGRVGNIKPIKLIDLIDIIIKTLNIKGVHYVGDDDKIIKRIAVGGGACADEYPSAIAKGCDVLITADMKYHIGLDGYEDGIAIVDAGHHGTEKHAVDIFYDMLKGKNVELIKFNYEDVLKFKTIDN